LPEVVPEPIASAPPGWIAGLPDTLKSNETFTKFKTVGDFANDYIAVSTKASELEQRVSNSIPKLKDDATETERAAYYDALGRPKDAKEYEFDGEDKNAPEWSSKWKQRFHSLGLTKAQGSQLSKEFNGEIQAMVDAHNTSLKNEVTAAETSLKTEWGDKFDTNVELAKRVYQKLNLSEFDKDFASGTDITRLSTIRFLMKVAAATGEDRSPQGGNGTPAKVTGNPFPKSNMQPART
jgi:hypothetical protein